MRRRIGCAATAALCNAGLRQRLGDLEALPFQGIGRDHVDLTEPGDTRRDRGEVINVAAEADFLQDFAAVLDEVLLENLCVTDAGIGVFEQQHRGARIHPLIGIVGEIDALHDLVGHNAKCPGIARLRDLYRGRAGIDQGYLGLINDWHDSERRVGALLADDDVRLELLDQALGSLRRGQGPAA